MCAFHSDVVYMWYGPHVSRALNACGCDAPFLGKADLLHQHLELIVQVIQGAGVPVGATTTTSTRVYGAWRNGERAGNGGGGWREGGEVGMREVERGMGGKGNRRKGRRKGLRGIQNGRCINIEVAVPIAVAVVVNVAVEEAVIAAAMGVCKGL